MGDQGNLERDVAVMAVQAQVQVRDLDRLREDFDEYRKETDKQIQALQRAQSWVLGLSAAVGGILTLGGSSILKFLAGVVAKG